MQEFTVMKYAAASASTMSIFFLSIPLIYFSANQMVMFVLPLFIRASGFSVIELGIISAVFGLALIIFEPLWGMLIDKVGAEKILKMTLLASPIVLFCYSLASDFKTFAVLRFLHGVFACGGGVSTRAHMRAVMSTGGRAFGAWTSLFSASQLVGPIIGGYMAAISYNSAFHIASIFSAAAFLLSFFVRSVNDRVKVGSKKILNRLTKREKEKLIKAFLLPVMPCLLLCGYMTYIPVYGKESPKFLLGTVDLGLALAFNGFAGFIASFFLGEASDRVGRKKIIIPGMFLQALAFLLLPTISGFLPLVLTSILLSLGNAAVSPTLMALLTDKISASKHGLVLGLFGAGEDAGIVLGPLLIGYMYQNYSPEFSFYITSGLMFVAIAYSYLLLKDGE
jgi:MFS family permease